MQNQFEDEDDVCSFISLLVRQLDEVIYMKSDEEIVNRVVHDLLSYPSIFEASLQVVLVKMIETYKPSG